MNPFRTKRDEREKDRASEKRVREKSDLVRMVEEEAKRRKERRLPYELQWRLNANFLLGNQHCDINIHRMTVENYKPLYEYMSGEVFNRIAPIMETRLAHLSTAGYELTVLPAEENSEDLLKADGAARLLARFQQSKEYASAFSRALGLCEQTGNGFLLCFWDEKQKRVGLTALSPYEVLPEDFGNETVEDQPSMILEQIKSAKEVNDLYGCQLEGEPVSGYQIGARAGVGGFGYEGASSSFEIAVKDQAVLLHTYMEKPGRRWPYGRLLITAGDQLLYEGVLPGGEYPLVQLKSKEVSGQFYGKSVIEDLIPLQRCYNGIQNRINDFINRSTCGQLLVEDGSVDADDLNEKGLVPGEPILYRRGSQLPKILEEPPLSEMASAQCRQLAEDMEYVAGVSGLMASGTLPGGVTSGAAIKTLRGIDTVRLAIFAENIRKGIRNWGRLLLHLYRLGLPEQGRVTDEEGKTVCFRRDLNSDRVGFQKENRLLEREEEKKARYIEALQLGLFSDSQGILPEDAKKRALRRLLGREEAGESEEERQSANAQNENEAFRRGEIPRLLPLDDHRLHLREHRLYALQKPFRKLYEEDPERAQVFLDHIQAHEQALQKGEKYER